MGNTAYIIMTRPYADLTNIVFDIFLNCLLFLDKLSYFELVTAHNIKLLLTIIFMNFPGYAILSIVLTWSFSRYNETFIWM